MIKFSSFTKTYPSQKNPSVMDFSLVCPEKSCTGLLGENGAGKSTLLKACAAQHYATEGLVEVCNYNAAENPVEVKKITGFVEESALFDGYAGDLTVKEILYFKGKTAFDSESDFEKAFENAVNELELKEVLSKKCKTLSKGFRQRLSFALALIGNPKVIVMDESMNGLDPSQIVKMRRLIKKLSREKTVLLSTHNISDAEELCDKICIISRGKKVIEGTAEDIIKQTGSDDLESAFLKVVQNA